MHIPTYVCMKWGERGETGKGGDKRGEGREREKGREGQSEEREISYNCSENI